MEPQMWKHYKCKEPYLYKNWVIMSMGIKHMTYMEIFLQYLAHFIKMGQCKKDRTPVIYHFEMKKYDWITFLTVQWFQWYGQNYNIFLHVQNSSKQSHKQHFKWNKISQICIIDLL